MSNQSEKPNILSLSLDEIKDIFLDKGEPKFRGTQVFIWLHQNRISSFDEMTSLSLELRRWLAENYSIYDFKLVQKQVSIIDGTIKYLYGLSDHNAIESVQMEYRHGTSLCISTQVGCRMGCSFCASTIGGLVRNLGADEMLSQVYKSEELSGKNISNIVLMGIGEPLDNFDEVVKFLQIISHPKGKNISLRNITLSTCGLADKILELAELKLPITLAVSLHAPNDRCRGELMPINKKYNIQELLSACKVYFNKTGRRITFEYALIDGKNDTIEEANELSQLLVNFKNSHINLIPINKVETKEFDPSCKKAVELFRKQLEKNGLSATVRREMGSDISAACGQLRHEAT